MDKPCKKCGLQPALKTVSRSNNFRCRCPQHPKPRNAFALHAKMRRAAVFKDKRVPRGGQTNKQRLYVEEE